MYNKWHNASIAVKKGFFLKVNQNGFCKDCERIETLNHEEQGLKNYLDSLKNELSDQKALYNLIAEKAKNDALQSVNEEISKKMRQYSS